MMHRNVGELVHDRRVVSLPPGATVRQAAGAMKAGHVASVVIAADDEHLEGIFTERDLTERVVAPGLDPDRTPLKAVMTPCPVTVDLDTSVSSSLRAMTDQGVRHLPIVHDGHVVGVVSIRDFMGDELADLERERELVESLTEVL